MIIRIATCCFGFREMEKKLIILPTYEDGEPSHIYKIHLYIDTVLIQYCPLCGEKVQLFEDEEVDSD